MPLKLLSRLASRRRQAQAQAGAQPLTIIDFSGDAVILPSGKVITRDMILSIDPTTGIIIYKDIDGVIREERLRPSQPPMQGGATRYGTDGAPITYT